MRVKKKRKPKESLRCDSSNAENIPFQSGEISNIKITILFKKEV